MIVCTTTHGIEFDAAKNEANVAKHGIDLSTALDFEFETAIIWVDNRRNYGETREIAIGYIGNRLHLLVYTRRMQALRIIGLRKANEREETRYLHGQP